MPWKDFNYGGRVYDPSHLHPRIFRFTRTAEGAPTQPKSSMWKCDSRFIAFRAGRETAKRSILYWFTPMITKLGYSTFGAMKCPSGSPRSSRDCRLGKPRHNKSRGNYFSVELVGKNGDTVEYDIFFKVRKPEKGRLEMIVETAFVRDPGYGSTRPDGKPVPVLDHPAQYPARVDDSDINSNGPR